MPTRIDLIEGDVPVLWVQYQGLVNPEHRRMPVTETAILAKASDCCRIMVDFRPAHMLEADHGTCEAIAEHLVDHFRDRDTRIAYLVKFDHQLDDAVERFLTERNITNARFRNFDEALAWLQVPPRFPSRDRVDPRVVPVLQDLVAAGLDEEHARRLVARLAEALGTPDAGELGQPGPG